MKTQDELQPAVEREGRMTVRKSYHKPGLRQYDDLRTVTLGSSPGGAESNGTQGFKRVGTSPPFFEEGSSQGSSAADNIYGGN